MLCAQKSGEPLRSPLFLFDGVFVCGQPFFKLLNGQGRLCVDLNGGI